jgi:hypothetical protein
MAGLTLNPPKRIWHSHYRSYLRPLVRSLPVRSQGLDAIFNSPVAYQVLQLVENETWIIVAQIDVKERNGLTNDGTQQSTQISTKCWSWIWITNWRIEYVVIEYTHYEKMGSLATTFATQFLTYSGHLQLIIFLQCEC